MNNQNISKIYENLFRLESKKGSYPIHKKLNLPGHEDIYSWISSEYDFAKGAKVLDAGCGVGYGSLLLASEHDIEIEGISLSESEISQAKKNITNKSIKSKVSFNVRSFDDVKESNYDIVIAVESLKHSLNLSKTLRALKKSLKPNGYIIIVEDFYHRENYNNSARKYIRDWSLVDAFRESDYLDVLDAAKVNWFDLTKHMPSKYKFNLKMKLALLTIASWFKGKAPLNLYQIFRGGFYLDHLYADKLMSYKALCFRNI